MRARGREGRDSSHRAFEELLSEQLDALYRTALRLCGGREADAEDLLQDTALRALRGFRDLRDQDAGRSGLFTILMRTHLNRVRTARRRAETFSGDLEEPAFERVLEEWRSSDTPEDVLESRDLRERLAAALDALEPGMRGVIWLVDVEEFRQWEVAEMLEIPEGTVASRLYRARRKLPCTTSRSAPPMSIPCATGWSRGCPLPCTSRRSPMPCSKAHGFVSWTGGVAPCSATASMAGWFHTTSCLQAVPTAPCWILRRSAMKRRWVTGSSRGGRPGSFTRSSAICRESGLTPWPVSALIGPQLWAWTNDDGSLTAL